MIKYEYKEVTADAPLTSAPATLLMIHFDNTGSVDETISLKDGSAEKIKILALKNTDRAIQIKGGVTFLSGIKVAGLGANKKVKFGIFWKLGAVVQDPTVDTCDPPTGYPGESKLITITGTNFQDGATVSFDGNGVKVIWKKAKFLTTNSLQARIKIEPSAQALKHEVTVTNPDGTHGKKADCFQVI